MKLFSILLIAVLMFGCTSIPQNMEIIAELGDGWYILREGDQGYVYHKSGTMETLPDDHLPWDQMKELDING